MESAFKLKLGRRFEAGLCAVGRFDGKHPALCCASGACGQVSRPRGRAFARRSSAAAPVE